MILSITILTPLQDVFMMTEYNFMRREVQVAHIAEKRNSYRFLVGKPVEN
jgi:hypothetical protein